LFGRKAHQFVLEVYKLTKNFPREEVFGLTSQFRKAAVSIPANIVEGYKKKGKNDKVRFFNISEGSLEECKYYIILSKDLEYVTNGDLLIPAEEISKLLNSYSKAILNDKN
jgi:four helix bundle protein